MKVQIFWHKQVAYLLAMVTIGKLHVYVYDYAVWSYRKHEYCYTLNLGFLELNWEREP